MPRVVWERGFEGADPRWRWSASMPFKVVGFDLQLHDCELIDLPFYDAEKKIPRGLEVAEV